MIHQKNNRLRRAARTRAKILNRGAIRLCVFRSNQHIYAQIIDGDRVLAAASTLKKGVRGSNISSAEKVGKEIAEKATVIGIQKVAFDRGGFHFHGRVKALADAARANGLVF